MVKIIQGFVNDLSSRTILFIIALVAITVSPDLREWTVGIFNILPESVEGIAQENPVLELILLAGAYYGRKNVRAKI